MSGERRRESVGETIFITCILLLFCCFSFVGFPFSIHHACILLHTLYIQVEMIYLNTRCQFTFHHIRWQGHFSKYTHYIHVCVRCACVCVCVCVLCMCWLPLSNIALWGQRQKKPLDLIFVELKIIWRGSDTYNTYKLIIIHILMVRIYLDYFLVSFLSIIYVFCIV